MRLSACGVAVCVLLLCATPAWAYIDPGSSSVAYQLLIAGALAVVFRFRGLLGRIAGFFTGRRRTPGDRDTAARD